MDQPNIHRMSDLIYFKLLSPQYVQKEAGTMGGGEEGVVQQRTRTDDWADKISFIRAGARCLSPLCVWLVSSRDTLCSCSVCKHPMKCPPDTFFFSFGDLRLGICIGA